MSLSLASWKNLKIATQCSFKWFLSFIFPNFCLKYLFSCNIQVLWALACVANSSTIEVQTGAEEPLILPPVILGSSFWFSGISQSCTTCTPALTPNLPAPAPLLFLFVCFLLLVVSERVEKMLTVILFVWIHRFLPCWHPFPSSALRAISPQLTSKCKWDWREFLFMMRKQALHVLLMSQALNYCFLFFLPYNA